MPRRNLSTGTGQGIFISIRCEPKLFKRIIKKSDERILGDGNFVEQVLSVANEQMDRKNMLIAKGYNLETIADKVSSVLGVDASEIWKSGKLRNRVAARSLFCFWATRDLGISMTELSKRLNLSPSGVSQSAIRGEKIAEINGFKLLEN